MTQREGVEKESHVSFFRRATSIAAAWLSRALPEVWHRQEVADCLSQELHPTYPVLEPAVPESCGPRPAPVSPGRLTWAHLTNGNTHTLPLHPTPHRFLSHRKKIFIQILCFEWRNYTVMETFSLWHKGESCSPNKGRGYIISIWNYLDGILQYSIYFKTWFFFSCLNTLEYVSYNSWCLVFEEIGCIKRVFLGIRGPVPGADGQLYVRGGKDHPKAKVPLYNTWPPSSACC